MNKYFIVSGLRRSGTSMLMYALKESGIPILGFKFSIAKDALKRKEGNPNGYWELRKVTTDKGLFYDLNTVEGLDGKVVKVMFEALPESDPKLIDKVILIFRKPKNWLSSILKWNKIEQLDSFVAHNILDTIDSLGFLMLNDIKHKIVFYEDIVENPEEQMKSICEFLGEGDYKKATKTVDVKLNRSEESDTQSVYLEDLEKVYNLAKSNQIMKIIEMEGQLKAKIEASHLATRC